MGLEASFDKFLSEELDVPAGILTRTPIADYRIARDFVDRAASSGDLETIVRASDSALKAFSEGPLSEFYASKLLSRIQGHLCRVLMYVNNDKYSALIHSADPALLTYLKPFFTASDRECPEKNKKRYYNLQHAFSNLIGLDSFRSLAPNVLREDIANNPVFSGSYKILPGAVLAEFMEAASKTAFAASKLGVDCDFGSLPECVVYVLDNFGALSKETFELAKTSFSALRHADESRAVSLLERRIRDGFGSLEGAVFSVHNPDFSEKLALLARYFVIYDGVFDKEPSESDQDAFLAVVDKIYGEFGSTLYGCSFFQNIQAALSSFGKGKEWLSGALSKDADLSGVDAANRFEWFLGGENKSALPVEALPRLLDSGLARLNSLLDGVFSFYEFEQVYTVLADLVDGGYFGNNAESARSSLAGLGARCVAACRRDVRDSLDLLVLKANCPEIINSILPGMDVKPRLINRYEQLSREMMSREHSAKELNDIEPAYSLKLDGSTSLFSTVSLFYLFLHCVSRYSVSVCRVHDRAKAPLDSAITTPVRTEIFGYVTNALRFLGGMDDSYVCANGKLVSRKASFEDVEAMNAICGLYALVDFLGGDAGSCVASYYDWVSDRQKRVSGHRSYDDRFLGLRNGYGLDVDFDSEVRDLSASMSLAFPGGFHFTNSLSIPGFFTGGKNG